MTEPRFPRRQARSPNLIPDEELRAAIAKSKSLREAATRLGLSSGALGPRATLRKRIQVLQIPVEHLRYQNGVTGNEDGRGIRIEKVLVLEHGRASFSPNEVLRKAIAAKLLPEQCFYCEQGPIWQGKPLRFRLFHLNNNRCDNRLENLRVTCPNCYDQRNVIVMPKRPRKKATAPLKDYAKLLEQDGILPKYPK